MLLFEVVTDRIGWLVEDSHVVGFFEVCENIKMCSVCITHLLATGAHGRSFLTIRSSRSVPVANELSVCIIWAIGIFCTSQTKENLIIL